MLETTFYSHDKAFRSRHKLRKSTGLFHLRSGGSLPLAETSVSGSSGCGFTASTIFTSTRCPNLNCVG